MTEDVQNKFMVGAQGNDIVVLRLGKKFSQDDALNLAAWLVALADHDGKFSSLLETVQNT